MNQLIINDIEYMVILIFLGVIFFNSLKKKKEIEKEILFDRSASNFLKGISCIFILIAHFYSMQHLYDNKDISWLHISKLCGQFSANSALVIFMFISGYGLSISHSRKESFFFFCKHRLWKIYKPLLIVSLVSIIFYMILPNSYSIEELSHYFINSIVYKSHFPTQYPTDIILSALGYLDWYVCCISIFYIIHWISNYFFNTRFSKSSILLLLMIIYYIIAYFYIGKEQAHFYRFPWAFLAGHFIANFQEYKIREKWLLGTPYILFTSISFYNEDKIQITGWIIAICILFFTILVNKKYTIDGFIISYLSKTSYFIYLTHLRIAFVAILFIGIHSLLLAIFFTLLTSTVFSKILEHNKISNQQKI